MTPALAKIALNAAQAYLSAPPLNEGRTPVEFEKEFDSRRLKIIESALRPVLRQYLEKSLSTNDFKRQIDGINKQNKLWGFSGTKGQMFFNLLVNAVEELKSTSELDNQLRLSINKPGSDEKARSTLTNFRSYVEQVGRQFTAAGGETRSRPSPNSVPFFLSYFWQVQEPDSWPVYYTRA